MRPFETATNELPDVTQPPDVRTDHPPSNVVVEVSRRTGACGLGVACGCVTLAARDADVPERAASAFPENIVAAVNAMMIETLAYPMAFVPAGGVLPSSADRDIFRQL